MKPTVEKKSHRDSNRKVQFQAGNSHIKVEISKKNSETLIKSGMARISDLSVDEKNKVATLVRRLVDIGRDYEDLSERSARENRNHKNEIESLFIEMKNQSEAYISRMKYDESNNTALKEKYFSVLSLLQKYQLKLSQIVDQLKAYENDLQIKSSCIEDMSHELSGFKKLCQSQTETIETLNSQLSQLQYFKEYSETVTVNLSSSNQLLESYQTKIESSDRIIANLHQQLNEVHEQIHSYELRYLQLQEQVSRTSKATTTFAPLKSILSPVTPSSTSSRAVDREPSVQSCRQTVQLDRYSLKQESSNAYGGRTTETDRSFASPNTVTGTACRSEGSTGYTPPTSTPLLPLADIDCVTPDTEPWDKETVTAPDSASSTSGSYTCRKTRRTPAVTFETSPPRTVPYGDRWQSQSQSQSDYFIRDRNYYSTASDSNARYPQAGIAYNSPSRSSAGEESDDDSGWEVEEESHDATYRPYQRKRPLRRPGGDSASGTKAFRSPKKIDRITSTASTAAATSLASSHSVHSRSSQASATGSDGPHVCWDGQDASAKIRPRNLVTGGDIPAANKIPSTTVVYPALAEHKRVSAGGRTLSNTSTGSSSVSRSSSGPFNIRNTKANVNSSSSGSKSSSSGGGTDGFQYERERPTAAAEASKPKYDPQLYNLVLSLELQQVS